MLARRPAARRTRRSPAAPARRTGRAPRAVRRPGRGGDRPGRHQDGAAREHPLQVRRRHRMTQRGGVVLAQRRDRELAGREREAEVGVGELGAQPVAGGADDLGVVEGRVRQRRRRDARWCRRARPGRRRTGRGRGTRWRRAGSRDTPVGSLNTASCSTCATSRTSTFSASWRRTDASTSSSSPSRPPGRAQRPASGAMARSPGEDLQPAVADLQDGGEHLVRRRSRAALGHVPIVGPASGRPAGAGRRERHMTGR